jgi:hypothetical protein
MLSRRSLLGSLVKSLLAAGVIAAPSAAVVVPSEGAEAARLDAASGRCGGRCGIRRIHTDLLWIVEFTRDIAGAAYSPQASAS